MHSVREVWDSLNECKTAFLRWKEIDSCVLIHFLCFAALHLFDMFDPVQHLISFVPALYRLWLDSPA